MLEDYNLLYTYCHLTDCIKHVYTYLLCALTTDSSNITTSNIFILFWLVTTYIQIDNMYFRKDKD